MVNITNKTNSLREAIAQAIVRVSNEKTIQAVIQKKIPKGDIYEFSRAAGLLAIKKTSDMIPDCHPLPVEFSAISFEIKDLEIVITVEVHTIYKTGVEVEAMHGAAVTALTIYDMLKPVDKQVEIAAIRLISKKGGKSSLQHSGNESIKTGVIICSDSVAAGKTGDSSGAAVEEKLAKFNISIDKMEIVSDEIESIRETVQEFVSAQYQLVILTGGTGLSERDITPEAIAPMLDREIPGIMEAARNYGQQRTGYAMLSRGIAGFIKNTLVITLPGSPKGVKESMDAIFPYVLHVFRVAAGIRHD